MTSEEIKHNLGTLFEAPLDGLARLLTPEAKTQHLLNCLVKAGLEIAYQLALANERHGDTVNETARTAYEQGAKHEREKLQKLTMHRFWKRIDDVNSSCGMCGFPERHEIHRFGAEPEASKVVTHPFTPIGMGDNACGICALPRHYAIHDVPPTSANETDSMLEKAQRYCGECETALGPDGFCTPCNITPSRQDIYVSTPTNEAHQRAAGRRKPTSANETDSKPEGPAGGNS